MLFRCLATNRRNSIAALAVSGAVSRADVPFLQRLAIMRRRVRERVPAYGGGRAATCRSVGAAEEPVTPYSRSMGGTRALVGLPSRPRRGGLRRVPAVVPVTRRQIV